LLRKFLGFAAFIATGMGLIIISFIQSSNMLSKALLAILTIFYIVGLSIHFKELQEGGN
jgi:hypothetical protein